MKNILVLSSTLGYDDVRIMKEVHSLRDNGYNVIVVGRLNGSVKNYEYTEREGIIYYAIPQDSNLSSKILNNVIKSSWIYRNSLIYYMFYNTLKFFSKINFLKKNYNKIIYYNFIYQVFENDLLNLITEKKLEIDIVHGHDLFSLAAAHRISVEYQVPLIYDAHEYYSDYSSTEGLFSTYRTKYLEKTYLKNQANVITVSDAIGEKIQNEYNPKEVNIIYNSPYIKKSAITSSIRKDANIKKNTPLIIYVGKFTFDYQQGNKILIDMLEYYKEAHFATVGPRNDEHDLETKKRAKKLDVEKRVHFLDKVPIESVVEYITDSDAGVVLFQTDVLNHVLCLGNKFFEMGFANVPVIYRTGLTEIDRIAKEFEFGYELEDQTASGLANALRKIHNEPSRYRMCPNKHKIFKETFSWEKQEKKLIDIYQKYLTQ